MTDTIPGLIGLAGVAIAAVFPSVRVNKSLNESRNAEERRKKRNLYDKLVTALLHYQSNPKRGRGMLEEIQRSFLYASDQVVGLLSNYARCAFELQ